MGTGCPVFIQLQAVIINRLRFTLQEQGGGTAVSFCKDPDEFLCACAVSVLALVHPLCQRRNGQSFVGRSLLVPAGAHSGEGAVRAPPAQVHFTAHDTTQSPTSPSHPSQYLHLCGQPLSPSLYRSTLLWPMHAVRQDNRTSTQSEPRYSNTGIYPVTCNLSHSTNYVQ